jgi:DNA-binding response OmpR family regulator
VVEDHEHVAYLLEHMLRREGFEVALTADGRGAADYISTQSAPTVVLMDVMLPYLDGFELTRLIRAHPAWRKVPVIMLSGRSTEEDVVRALEAGANDFVSKPYRPKELLARIVHRVREAERL